jgi:hypothetical protein
MAERGIVLKETGKEDIFYYVLEDIGDYFYLPYYNHIVIDKKVYQNCGFYTDKKSNNKIYTYYYQGLQSELMKIDIRYNPNFDLAFCKNIDDLLIERKK